jgi:hypothetical protein
MSHSVKYQYKNEVWYPVELNIKYAREKQPKKEVLLLYRIPISLLKENVISAITCRILTNTESFCIRKANIIYEKG